MAGGGEQLRTIRKIQRACNLLYDEHLCFNIVQFWSEQEKRNISRYTIVKQYNDKETGKHSKEELFASYSLINTVYFMRDYWYLLNGIELPTDYEKWNELRKETVLCNGSIIKKERIQYGEEVS